MKELTKVEKICFGGVLFFGSLLIFSFFNSPVNESDIIFKSIQLTGNPKFEKKSKGSGGTSYKMILESNSQNFELTGTDYQYLKHQQFKKDVSKGSWLLIGIWEEQIVKMNSNGTEYLQFEKAQEHKRKNRLFFNSFLITGLALSLLPFFVHKLKEVSFGKVKNYTINYELILFSGLAICLIILFLIFGIDVGSSAEFME